MNFSKFILSEMAMKQGDDMGLFVEPGFIAMFKTGLGSHWRKAIMQQNIDFAVDGTGKSLLYGVMTIRDNVLFKTWEVDSVWAEKGYGPYLYLLAMSVVHPDGLAPTRITSMISPAAKKVWSEFSQGAGSHLVKPVYLKSTDKELDKIYLTTPGKGPHKDAYLNYKYIIKNPINYKPMVAKGNMIFRNTDARDIFMEMATGVLKDKLSDIY